MIRSYLLLLFMVPLLTMCSSFEEKNDLSSSVKVLSLDGTNKNPIVSHIYTADPTGRAFEGRLYVYASHDLDDQSGYNMYDYHVFSTDDLVNWQDHGVAFDAREDVSWANYLYAPDCIERDGKYYLFFPNNGSAIGVAVSDYPYGPFKDAIGAPLIDSGTPGNTSVDGDEVQWIFDPGILIDDDGQAYLYYGGGMPQINSNTDDYEKRCRVIKLNDDMISIDGSAEVVPAPGFFEASFIYKKDGKYYFSYSSHWQSGFNISIEYMMSDNPMTGWEHKGTVLPKPPQGAENNHHSMVEYQGQWYILYHNMKLAQANNATKYQRSITIDKLEYNEDGTLKRVSSTDGTVEQLKNIDPFNWIEAELLAAESGVEVETLKRDDGTRDAALTELVSGDWSGISRVDFGEGASAFKAKLSADKAGSFELWIDGGPKDFSGKKLGTLEFDSTSGDAGDWEVFDCSIKRVSGVHNFYIVYKGKEDSGLLLDSYIFE